MRSGKRLIALALLCVAAACGVAIAADADLQQYNRPAMNAEAVNAANALTSSMLLPVDGKLITADSNALGRAPINRSLKQMADYMSGLRCAVFGTCIGAGVTPRTFNSLNVDAVGGQPSTVPSGTIQAAGELLLGATKSGAALPTTGNDWGTFTKESALMGGGRVSWNGSTYTFGGGFNISAITPVTPGVVRITFNSLPANPGRCFGAANGHFNSAAVFVEVNTFSTSGGKLTETLFIKDSGASAVDAGFTFMTFCG